MNRRSRRGRSASRHGSSLDATRFISYRTLILAPVLSTIALAGCSAAESRDTNQATKSTAPTPGEYVDQQVSDCQGWGAVSEYGPVTLRPVPMDSPDRRHVGDLCKVEGFEDVYRATFAPTGWCGDDSAVDVRVPAARASPVVTVRPIGSKPNACTLGGTIPRASIVVFITTSSSNDVRIDYPDPSRSTRIDAERASGELSTISQAITRCADKEERGPFNPPAACLDLAHLRAIDDSMRDVRSSASIQRATDSYDITVPFRVNDKSMAVRVTHTHDEMAIEHGDIPYP